MSNAVEDLVAGLIMNIVAQEERHTVRVAALSGRDLASEETLDWVHKETVANVIKRFPDSVRGYLRQMLLGDDGLRDMFRTDLARCKDADWLKT